METTGTTSAQTVQNKRWAVEKHIIPAFGAVQLSKLSDPHVTGLLTNLAPVLSASSLGRLRSTLSEALDLAVARALATRNAAHTVDLPKNLRPTKRKESLDLDEARRLRVWLSAACATEWPLAAAVAVQLGTGLRPGEVLALCWGSVELDAERPVVHVTTAMVRVPNADGHGAIPQLGAPKTDRSARTVRLPIWAVDALRRHREVAVILGHAEPDDLVFGSSRRPGTLLEPSTYRAAVTKIAAAAGVRRFTPHEARHTSASVLIDGGTPLLAVADRLGHRTTRVTELVYRRQLSPVVDAGADILDAL